jgi:tetratricopeptide (TPR) repeat protein
MSKKKLVFEIIPQNKKVLFCCLIIVIIIPLSAVLVMKLENKPKMSESEKIEKINVFYSDANKALVNKNYKESIEGFKKALELDPKNYNASFNLGISYYGNKDYQDSIDILNKAIGLQDNPAIKSNTFNILGNVYRDSGNKNNSEDSYRKSIELNYRNFNAYINLATLLNGESKTVEAITILKEGHGKNPNQIELTALWIRTLVQAGQKGEAQDIYNELSPGEKNSSLIKSALGI